MPDRVKDTRRSRLLLSALDCINTNHYDEQHDFIIFGKDFNEILDKAGIPESEIERNPDRAHLRELASDVKAWSGREHAARRTSLSKPSKPERVRGLDKLSSDGLRNVMEYATRPRCNQPSGVSEGKALDELDAHYTQEVLKKLPEIVGRVSALEEIEVSDGRQIPSKDVKRYFDEAHRCYLYGFPIACAVLCRAILESALEETIDPDQRVYRTFKTLEREASKSGKPKPSYLQMLVDEAEKRRILTDDRPKCAIDVRNAGNDAIHNPSQFEKLLGNPRRGIAYIVNSTRKILIDLYSAGKE